MIISETTPTLANASLLGGNQTGATTVALAGGGYVVAFNSDTTGNKDVVFQRFDAFGAAIGGAVTANTTLPGQQVLADIVANADGSFTLAWVTGTNVITRSFDAGGNALGSEKTVAAGGVSSVSAQLIATASNQYKIVIASDVSPGGNVMIEQTTLTTLGVVGSAKATITSTAPVGSTVTEVIDGNAAGTNFILMSNGTVVSSNNGTMVNGGAAEDIVKLQSGFYALAGEQAQDVTLFGMFGTGNNLSSYGFGTPQAAQQPVAETPTSPDVFDRALVDLGGGRLLVVWVADTGTSFGLATDHDGIYAAVYNSNIGDYEQDSFTLVKDMGLLVSPANLQFIKLEADLLADGRVSLAYSVNNGLSGYDAYNTILDARDSNRGTTVNGTLWSGILIGTSLDDAVVPPDNPSVHPYNDTLSYANSSAGVRVDLDNAVLNRGDAAGDVAVNFETVIGTDFADQLRGHNQRLDPIDPFPYINPITGEVIAYLFETGNDVLLGGGGNDQIVGRGGNDFLDGGTGDDAISGGDGDDIILGGDGNDNIHGNAGRDVVDGGIGNDYVHGGAGDDNIDGGDGNDTVIGGDGDDILDGGNGNDVINGGGGFNVIDGGTGTDTASYAGSGAGVYVDLDHSSPLVGDMTGYDAEDDLIVNVENIIGSFGDDYLAGNAGVNILRGGEGNDVLFGRGGNDKLTGGAGADTFVFESAADGTDKINDFELGVDKVEIVSDNFGGINASNIVARLISSATGGAVGSSPQLLFDNKDPGFGNLFYDADGAGVGVAVLIATIVFTSTPDVVTGLPVFSASDFIFV